MNAARRLLLVAGKTKMPAPVKSLELVQLRDPDQALRRFTREHFDGVALELPGNEALEYTSRFRTADPQAVIILVATKEDPDFKQRAVRAGANAVVCRIPSAEARVRLLAATLETLRLVRLNHQLAQEAWETAGALTAVVRECKAARGRRNSERRSLPNQGSPSPDPTD